MNTIQNQYCLRPTRQSKNGVKHIPELCVDTFLERVKLPSNITTKEFTRKDSVIKAELIKTAAENPSPPPKSVDKERYLRTVYAGYRDKGYDPANHTKTVTIPSSDPERDCRLALEFADVIASSDAETASYMFKSILVYRGYAQKFLNIDK